MSKWPFLRQYKCSKCPNFTLWSLLAIGYVQNSRSWCKYTSLLDLKESFPRQCILLCIEPSFWNILTLNFIAILEDRKLTKHFHSTLSYASLAALIVFCTLKYCLKIYNKYIQTLCKYFKFSRCDVVICCRAWSKYVISAHWWHKLQPWSKHKDLQSQCSHVAYEHSQTAATTRQISWIRQQKTGRR